MKAIQMKTEDKRISCFQFYKSIHFLFVQDKLTLYQQSPIKCKTVETIKFLVTTHAPSKFTCIKFPSNQIFFV
jgi:hypothetical protein